MKPLLLNDREHKTNEFYVHKPIAGFICYKKSLGQKQCCVNTGEQGTLQLQGDGHSRSAVGRKARPYAK